MHAYFSGLGFLKEKEGISEGFVEQKIETGRDQIGAKDVLVDQHNGLAFQCELCNNEVSSRRELSHKIGLGDKEDD